MTLFRPLLVLVLVAAAPPPREDSEAAKLRRVWGETVDPEKDCTFKLDGEKLRIKVPEATHKLTPNEGPSRAPRVRREVKGDFDVRVKVVSVTGPDASGDGITAGGLVVGRSTESFVAFARYTSSGETDESTRPHVMFDNYLTPESDSRAFGIAAPDRPKPLHLRLVREKNKVTGYSCFDGTTWENRGSRDVNWADTIDVGVFTSHNCGKAVEGVFEEFKVTKTGK